MKVTEKEEMIKLKNILAENMLRSRINLSKSLQRKLRLENSNVLNEAFTANYWFSKIQDISNDQYWAFNITPTVWMNKELGSNKPVNEQADTIVVQFPKTVKSLADIEAELKKPGVELIWFDVNKDQSPTTVKQDKAVQWLSARLSYRTGRDPKTGQTGAVGYNCTPNNLFRALLESIGQQIGITA